MFGTRITWKDPEGNAASGTAFGIADATREAARLARGGCTEIKVWLGVPELTGQQTGRATRVGRDGR